MAPTAGPGHYVQPFAKRDDVIDRIRNVVAQSVVSHLQPGIDADTDNLDVQVATLDPTHIRHWSVQSGRFSYTTVWTLAYALRAAGTVVVDGHEVEFVYDSSTRIFPGGVGIWPKKTLVKGLKDWSAWTTKITDPSPNGEVLPDHGRLSFTLNGKDVSDPKSFGAAAR